MQNLLFTLLIGSVIKHVSGTTDGFKVVVNGQEIEGK